MCFAGVGAGRAAPSAFLAGGRLQTVDCEWSLVGGRLQVAACRPVCGHLARRPRRRPVLTPLPDVGGNEKTPVRSRLVLWSITHRACGMALPFVCMILLPVARIACMLALTVLFAFSTPTGEERLDGTSV